MNAAAEQMVPPDETPRRKRTSKQMKEAFYRGVEEGKRQERESGDGSMAIIGYWAALAVGGALGAIVTALIMAHGA